VPFFESIDALAERGGIEKNRKTHIYLQEFISIEHFRQKLIEYLDCCNNRRITEKLKGLPPALHRQQAFLAV